MRPRVGDNAFRVSGTNEGFRVRTHSTVIGVKTHVQLRNGDGLVSKFLPVTDFMISPNGQRETVWSYLIIWRNANGQICQKTCLNTVEASAVTESIRNINGTILAKKKIRVEI